MICLFFFFKNDFLDDVFGVFLMDFSDDLFGVF